MKINWPKVFLIVGGVMLTPFVILAVLVGLWLYNSGLEHQLFHHEISVSNSSSVIVSGDYIKDTEEVLCRKTVNYHYKWWSDEKGRFVEEHLESRDSQGYLDSCGTSETRPRIVQAVSIGLTSLLRVDDVIYSRLPYRGAKWKPRRFGPYYRVERFMPQRKMLVLVVRPNTGAGKSLPRLLMRADTFANWKRDMSASRRLSEPLLYPHGHLRATFVWARVPHNWHRKLAVWDGRGDLKARLRQIKASVIKVEVKPFEQRTESRLPYGKGKPPTDFLRAIAKWDSQGQISVHDTCFGSAGSLGRWNMPPDQSGAPGPVTFIWLGKTSPIETHHQGSRHRY